AKHLIDGERHGLFITEICSGIGQLSHLLANLGFRRLTAIDRDLPRFKASLELAFHIEYQACVICGRWQDFKTVLDRSQAIICTNSVNSNTAPGDIELLRAQLDRGAHLIWQPSLFGVENPEAKPLAGYNSVDVGHGVFHQWK